ncbi:MAG: metallophosphoesterase, partial [Chitinophagaceae bacterium]|nr:metallophosphoesterase [Chitinophagaceae bacterium]
MKWILTIFVLLALLQRTSAQDATSDSISNRIVVIGDAGDPGSVKDGKAVVLDAVRKKVAMDKKTTVLFVGDNLYYYGLPCEGDVCYKPGIDALHAQ